MPIRPSRFFGLLLAVCLSALACAAQASPFIFNKTGDEVLDMSTGWVWMRCSLGQSWNGQTCVGKATRLYFNGVESEVRSHTGWVVPSVAQLLSLRVCSAGESSDLVSVQGQGGGTFKQKCADGSNKPTITTSVFPETPTGFWSSLPCLDRNCAWGVYFGNGNVFDVRRGEFFHFRLVRANRFVGADGALAYVLGADFSSSVWAQGDVLERGLGAVPLSWLPKSAGNPLPLPPNVPTVDLQKMATNLKVLALADIHRAPGLATGLISPPKLTEPLREAFQPRPVSISQAKEVSQSIRLHFPLYSEPCLGPHMARETFDG
jgi:Protein of unknown function (DUF1566)